VHYRGYLEERGDPVEVWAWADGRVVWEIQTGCDESLSCKAMVDAGRIAGAVQALSDLGFFDFTGKRRYMTPDQPFSLISAGRNGDLRVYVSIHERCPGTRLGREFMRIWNGSRDIILSLLPEESELRTEQPDDCAILYRGIDAASGATVRMSVWSDGRIVRHVSSGCRGFRKDEANVDPGIVTQCLEKLNHIGFFDFAGKRNFEAHKKPVAYIRVRTGDQAASLESFHEYCPDSVFRPQDPEFLRLWQEAKQAVMLVLPVEWDQSGKATED
jgi:hypothetical protein